MTCKLPFWATNAWRKLLFGLGILIMGQFGTVLQAQTPYAFMPYPRVQYVDSNGSPLAGGKIFSYNAGTSTPAATYHLDTLGVISINQNPVILDSTGSAEVRLLPQYYKFVLTDSSGSQIWSVDQVADIGQILFSQAVLLNPVGGALQTIVGPLAASYFTQNTPHFTSPGVRVGILDPLTILDTPTNPPNLLSIPPAAAGQTDAIPDANSYNSTFVLSPGPPDWLASTAFVTGVSSSSILPRTNNPCDFLFLATTAGTTGVTNPVFSTLPCSTSPGTVADGTVVWTSQGAYPNTNVLDCTKTGLTCFRTAYIYFEGGGCNNTTAAMGWDTFGTNSPVPICISGSNVQKGVLALPSAATLIQEAPHSAAAATTNVTAYPAATTAGDLLEIDCVVDSSHTISGVTDGTNAYSKAKGVQNGATDLEIWYFNGTSTSMPASTNVTTTFTGTSSSVCDWKEYGGIAVSSALDQTASNTATGTSVTTGTTSGTAQSTELILSVVGSPANPSILGQIGWTQHAVTFQSTLLGLSSQGLIQQGTTAQSSTFTLGSSQAWASAIVTFKANVASTIQAQRGIVLPQYFLPQIPINSTMKWQVPRAPLGNGTGPTVDLGVALVCTPDGSTDDPAWNTTSNATPIIPSSSNNTLTTTLFSGITSTGCAAGNMLHFQIQRQRYNGADTSESYVYVTGVTLQFGISQ